LSLKQVLQHDRQPSFDASDTWRQSDMHGSGGLVEVVVLVLVVLVPLVDVVVLAVTVVVLLLVVVTTVDEVCANPGMAASTAHHITAATTRMGNVRLDGRLLVNRTRTAWCNCRVR
jgi:hypothetical protein